MSGLILSLAGTGSFAQVAVERVLNSLPEGLLLAACAWLLLRLIGRQNAGTRFAVWLMALVGVAGLPFLTGLTADGRALNVPSHAALTVPASWALFFVLLWAPLALVALVRMLAGIWQVRMIRKECTEVNLADVDESLRGAMQQQAMGRHVRLLVAEKARVPAAIGFFHPAIVLPAWCLRDMSADELRPILIHEMAHLRRRDDWTNLLQKAVRAVFFFHPAVWWIDARLSLEREMACDDAVVAATGDARAYAGSLIGLLERGCARRGWTMAQAAVARAREASVRIARILEVGGSATTRVGRGVLGLAAGLCVICCGVLEFAPQVVAFEPESSMVAHAPAHPFAPNAASAGSGMLAAHGVAIVPAAFHPAAPHRELPAGTTKKTSIAPADARVQQVIGSAQPPAPAPHVVLAKLDNSAAQSRVKALRAPTPTQIVLVVETDYSQPVENPNAGRKASAIASGHPDEDAPAGAFQVQTLQILEQDETGWHVQVYRVVMWVPATEDGSMRTSI